MLRELVEYWRTEFDGRAAEARINTFGHYRTTVNGVGLHYVRAGARGRPPLLLVHGWPDSFLRFDAPVGCGAENRVTLLTSAFVVAQATDDRPPAISMIAHYNTHRPHRSLHQQPPTGAPPPPSRAALRPLRRDRLGGLVHEYVQVA